MKITKEIKIACTAIVALVLLFLGLNFLKGVNVFTSTNTYRVHFPDAAGLAVSAPVFANGYAVGIVRDIEYDYAKGTGATVFVELDDEMRVPVGTRAELESELMGGVKMKLVLGQNPTKFITPSDTIPGSLHQGAMDQLGAMLPNVEKMLPKLDSILYNLQLLTGDPALPAILRNAEALTSDLAQTSSHLNTLMERDVPSLVANLDATVKKANTLIGNLSTLDVEQTMQSLNRTLDGAHTLTQNLGTTVETLNQSLRSKDNTLGLFLTDRSVYDNLNSTMAHADSLVIDLKAHPKRYVHFSVFGGKGK